MSRSFFGLVFFILAALGSLTASELTTNKESASEAFGIASAQRLPAPGTPVQFDCLPGTFSAGDACAPCPEGTFWQSKDTCVPCSPGTYTALDRSFKCIPCSGNTIAVDAGSIICTPCPKGFYTYDGIKCVFPSPSRTPTRKVVTTAPSKKKCSSVKNPAKPPVKCPSKP